MAGSEGAKPILQIEIDDSSWQSFLQSYANYKSQAEKSGDEWAKFNSGVRQTKGAFDDLDSSAEHLTDTLTNPKLSGSTSGAVVRITKESKETAKSWHAIARDIEKAGRTVSGIARSGFGGLFGLLGTAGALAGSVFGLTAQAAGGVAGDYKSSRQLGLELGKEKEFGIAGEPYGLGRDQLEEAANAKADPTKQLPFLNAGVSAQDLAKLDAAELAWRKAQGEAKLYSQWEKTSPQFAVAQAGAYFPGENPDQLRLLADAYDAGDLDKAHSAYEQNWEKTGYDLKTARDATAFKQDQSQKWAEVETAWNKDILMLAPHLDKWSDAAAHLVTGFLDNTAKTINDLADTGDNPTPPGTTPAHAAPDDYPGRIREGAQIAGQWLQQHGLPDPFNAPTAPAAQQGFTVDPNKTAHMAALERAWGLPKGFLLAQENIESSGGTNNINPANPNVLGAYQFDEPTAKRYGVNRHDEYSSTAGAAHYLADLHKKYGAWDKAVAAFDGFAGLDKDIAKYGNAWKAHISEFQKSGETAKYLQKLTDQGIDLNQQQSPFDDPKVMKATAVADSASTSPSPGAGSQSTNGQQAAPESLADRITRGLAIIGHTLQAGGGAQFRSPDGPARRATFNPAPQQNSITLHVNAPPGSDVNVTGAALVQ